MKKLFSLLAVLLFAGSMMAAEATLKYSGSTTTNMVGNGANNAATVGLDADLFTVLADKGSNTNLPGLNKAGDIRLYAAKDDGKGNTITVSIANGTIKSIVLDIKQNTSFEVKNGTEAVTESDGKYVIGSKTFSIQNTTKGESTQLQLNKITITYDEWSEITFTAATGTGVFNDSVFAAGEFKLTCVDTENKKLKTTANNCVFGTSADDKTTYAFRLQTGGKSSSKNMMNLTIPADGQLRIAVRTGSNDDATRTVILTQGETELYNKVVTENDTIEGVTNPKVYKYITVNVKKGTVAVTYPVNALNFYSFAFKAAAEPTPEPVVANFCKTEIGHFAAENADPNSFVLLSIGSKNGKTIVRIDQDAAKNTAMFDYLQVSGLASTGADVAEGGAKAMAVEFDTPALTNDSLTLEILWSTVNWDGRWMVQNVRAAVADCQYAVLVPVPLTPITCAEVYNKAKDDKVALNDVTVTYVNGKNVYVKDESGAMLLYLPANATWKAGDKLAGLEGVVDVYHGLYEIKPTAEQVAAVVATAGDAPAPAELAVAPVAADVNKYVILKNVSVAAGEFKTDKATNLNLTIGDATVVLRNNFKIAQVFDGDAKYNIVGAVAVYDDAVQIYFISAEEIIVPALNIFAYDLKASEVADGKVTIDYKLNAKATAVEIQLLDAEGAVKKTFDATGLKKGANQAIVDLEGVAAGTYNWAIKATAKPTAEMVNVLDYDKKLYNFYLPQGLAIDNSTESPFFGRIYVSESIDGMSDGSTDRTKSTKQGIFIYDPLLTDVTSQGVVGYKGSLKCASGSSDRNSFKRVVVDKEGFVYVNSLDANVGGVYRLDPANPKADLVPVLDTTKRGTLYAPISSILVEGQGEDKVLYTAENFVASASKGSINKYAIGNATNFAGKADTVVLNSSDYALGISDNQFVSDGRGGFWGCQHRWGYDVWAAVYHINANKVRDYVIMQDVNTNVLPQSSDVTTYRGVIAINEAKTLLAIPTKSRVVVYNIAYNAETGVPTLTEAYRTGAIFGTNIDGLAFDLAENLYVMSASKEKMFAFATVKAENNCTTPAAKASKIVVAGTGTAIDNSFVPVKAQKVVVNGQVLIIKDGKTYNMMGQIVK